MQIGELRAQGRLLARRDIELRVELAGGRGQLRDPRVESDVLVLLDREFMV